MSHINVAIPTSDYRTHPNSGIGAIYRIGNGIVHHDIVNIPFYGRIYDTAVIAHPLSPIDGFLDRRTRLSHITFLLNLLRDILEQSRDDPRTTFLEFNARRDSIEVLVAIRKNSCGRSGFPPEKPEGDDGLEEEDASEEDVEVEDDEDNDEDEAADMSFDDSASVLDATVSSLVKHVP
jgi:hypothetical protein